MATIKVTKLEAARRQLATAITLWSQDADPLSIHTLAAAAHQIIHDLNRRNKGSELFFDTSLVPKKHKQAFIHAMKFDQNFLKHAERGKAGQDNTLAFDPFYNDILIIMSVIGLRYLGQELTRHEIAFQAWQAVHRAHLLTDAGLALFQQSVHREGQAALRKMSKQQLFRALLQARR